MYYSSMKRDEIIKILENDNYSSDTIDSILCGRRKPNANNRYRYEKEHGIPFTAWGNLKSYLNSTNNQATNESTEGETNGQE